MFRSCSRLKDISPLAGWNVGNVQDMNHMFAACDFIRDIALSGWGTHSVKIMNGMFASCRQISDISPLEKMGRKQCHDNE